MSSPFRPVFLTCALAIASLAVPSAQAPDRPQSIRIRVDGKRITLDNGSESSTDRSKVWARAGGKVVFVIENRDDVAHDVTIPIGEFVPSLKYEVHATSAPIAAGQTDKITVDAHDVGVLVLRIKPESHFGFDKRDPWKTDPSKDDRSISRGMTYKYSIHTHPSGRTEMCLDPDIEVNRP